MSGLSSSGYEAPRTSEYLERIVDRFEALTGYRVEVERDLILGTLFAVVAYFLGQLSEATQSIYDARSRGNATGIQLDDLGAIVGVYRQAATYSSVTLTLTGTPGTIIPAGAVSSGGGSDGAARWIHSEAAVIPGGGSVTVVALAETAGAVVALAGEIDTIGTPVAGWASVTNAADATPGEDLESDADYRIRQVASLPARGSTSTAAIFGDLLALDFIQAAVVIENDDAVLKIVSGVLMQPNSVAVFLLPSTLTTAQGDEVAATIYDALSAGVYSQGVVTRTITGDSGASKIIRWSYATAVPRDVDYTLTLKSGYTLGDVTAALTASVNAYFDALAVGESVTILDLLGLAGAIEGIKGASVLIQGAAVDYDPNINQYAVLDTLTIA